LWEGVVFGQVGLAAIWLALGRPRALVRIYGAGAAFVSLGGAYLIGYLWRESFDDALTRFEGLPQQIEAILLVPIFTFSAAAPLWLLRLFLGWQIRQESSRAASNSRQYSISGLVLLTTLVAALLGVAVQACRINLTPPGEFWLGLFGWSLGLSLLSVLLLLPAALLTSRHPILGAALLCIFTLILYTILACYTLAILRAFGGGTPALIEDVRVIAFIGCPFLGLLVTLCVPLAAVRWLGYRLVMGGKTEAKLTERVQSTKY
jgi:hypothetical protein